MPRNVASTGTKNEGDPSPGQKLRAQRERARVRQKDLAARAHIGVKTLQDMEQGKDRDRDMSKSVRAAREALAAILSESPEPEVTRPRRLRAVEAQLMDSEDVVEVVTREPRPGVRVMTIVLLDSDQELDDETRAVLQSLADKANADVNNG